jgi:hypothetical protein
MAGRTRSTSRTRRFLLLTAGAAAAAAAAPAGAQAALTFSGLSESSFLFVGGLNERNSIVVEAVNTGLRVTEQRPDGPLLLALVPCSGGGGTRVVECGTNLDPRLARSAPSLRGDLSSLDDSVRVVGNVAVDIDGGLGNDSLGGGPLNDRLDGDENVETEFIRGEAGNDQLIGDIGIDNLDGGPGEDQISGGLQPDFIRSRDGERDTIFCGSGVFKDGVEADLQDTFPGGDCEEISRSPAGLVPVVLSRARLAGTSARARLRCPAAVGGPCAGVLSARGVRQRGKRLVETRSLAKVRYTVPSGQAKTIRMPLSIGEVAAIRRAGRLRVTSVEPGNQLGPKTVFATVVV